MGVAHWDSQQIQRNLDEMVADPAHPLAFPAENPADLMGRLRVKLRAGDGALEAYGFRGQKIVIPVSEIGAVETTNEYQLRGRKRERGLLVLDHNRQVLLRADGLWETYGEVARVCRALGLPRPTHQYAAYSAVSSGSGSSRRNRNATVSSRNTRTRIYSAAPEYQWLRMHARGHGWLMLLKGLVWLAMMGLGVFIGLLPALFLPEWIGAVRTLLLIAGGALGLCAGIWVCGTVSRLLTDALRWSYASMRAKGWAPADRFFGGVWETEIWGRIATAALVLSVPACVIWGPVIGIISGAHGLSDSALVADLRAHGARTQGNLIDVPTYSEDNDGNEERTDHATLSFRADGEDQEVTDPAIRGQALPLDDDDPEGTSYPVTVVYDINDPGKAAEASQLVGSVWHGAPTANVIAGGVLTAALPLALLGAIFRISRRRQRSASMLKDLAGS